VLFPFRVEAGSFLGVNALPADLDQSAARSQPQHEHQYRFHFLHEYFSSWRQSSGRSVALSVTLQLKVDFKASGLL
jgi:hypothetical protein